MARTQLKNEPTPDFTGVTVVEQHGSARILAAPSSSPEACEWLLVLCNPNIVQSGETT